jgi:hypothetical protein
MSVSGWRVFPHLLAHRLFHIIRQCEKVTLPYARHRADRHHIGEHPAVWAEKPYVVRSCHHIDEVADGDHRAQRETFRHRPAGQRGDVIESVGLQHARGMDREWPTI